MTKRTDGTPFSYHSCDLTYTVDPFGTLYVSLRPFRQNVDVQYVSAIAGLIRKHVKEFSPVLALYYVMHNCVEEGAFVELSEAFDPNAVRETMPTWRLALESSRYSFPIDDRTFPVLEGAFAVLYPFLEACIAIAEGESYQLSERINTFKHWYREASREMRPSLMRYQPHKRNLLSICLHWTVMQSSAPASGGRCWRATIGPVAVAGDRRGRMVCCWRSTISCRVREGGPAS